MTSNINEIYKSESNHLKADDIPPGKQIQLTITGGTVEDFDGKHKIVLQFQGTDKTMVLNKTNATMIASVHGPDYQSWVGKSIFVYATKVDFGGKMVDAIRVDMPRETIPAAQPYAPPAPPSQDFDNFDDDVPF